MVGRRWAARAIVAGALVAAAAPRPAAAEMSGGKAALLSLLVPGLGQWQLGDHRMAGVFAGVEGLGWAGYATYRHQESLRHDSQVLFAKIHARVDVAPYGENFERDVGTFLSSDEYNRSIVLFNAENIYSNVADTQQREKLIQDYLAANSYTGGQTWNWDSNSDRLEYVDVLKSALRSHRNGNLALGIVVANHLLSAVDALRPRHHGDGRVSAWNAVPSLSLRVDGSTSLTWSASF